MNERRQASAEFNVEKYKYGNPDLAAVFGYEWPAYYNHYITCGKQEIAEGKRKPL